MSIKNKVIRETFVNTHYLKKFQKKYKSHFQILWQAFEIMLEKIELLLLKDRNNIISEKNNVAICKLDFQSEPKKSAKHSGSRCIVAWHQEEKIVKILLAYSKNDVVGNHETVWWKNMIRENYLEYENIIN